MQADSGSDPQMGGRSGISMLPDASLGGGGHQRALGLNTSPALRQTSQYGVTPTARPLTQRDITNSPYTPPGVRDALQGREIGAVRSPIRVASTQQIGRLTGTEQHGLGAAAQGAGMAEQDYFELAKRLSQTGAPPPTRYGSTPTSRY